jgi:hypothetical protein
LKGWTLYPLETRAAIRPIEIVVLPEEERSAEIRTLGIVSALVSDSLL